jgi:hypothetical protein
MRVFLMYTGPAIVGQVFESLRLASLPVTFQGTEHVYFGETVIPGQSLADVAWILQKKVEEVYGTGAGFRVFPI